MWFGATNRAFTPSATAPGAPTIGAATAGNGQATVAFTAPGSNGGSPITGYIATSSPGGLTGSSSGSPITVAGLTNGTAYTFSVQAINVIGTGSASGASNSVTPNVSVPDQVINVLFQTDGTPGTGYAIFPMPAGNGSAITQFEGITSGGGTGLQVRFTLSNSSIDALSCRVDFSGLSNTSQTCQIRAHNANGSGSYSVASNAITPVAFVDTWVDSANCHYVQCGGSQTGLSSLWHDGYFDGQFTRYVNPGDATLAGTVVPTMNAPAYPPGVGMTSQKLVEVTPQSAGGYGLLVNIMLQNPALGTNGIFNANPYSRFAFYIYPTQAGTYAALRTETTYNVEGQAASVTGSTVTYANQTLAVNTFPGGSTGVFDRSNGNSAGYVSNTGTVITTSAMAATAGDYVLTQVGDQIVGTNINDISAFVVGPTPGTLTLNQWNRVELPLGPTGWDMLAHNNGMHYKWSISMPAPSPKSVTYFCKTCFAV